MHTARYVRLYTDPRGDTHFEDIGTTPVDKGDAGMAVGERHTIVPRIQSGSAVDDPSAAQPRQ